MGNGTSTGQGNYTTYGSRDVGSLVEQGQQHWPSELAEASNIKKSHSLFLSDQKPHIGATNVGLKSSSLSKSSSPNSIKFEDGLPNSMEDNMRVGASVRFQKPHIGDQRRTRSSLLEDEHSNSAGQLFEIRTPIAELERGVRSHHWMKFRILRHHRIHQKSIWILHFRSLRIASTLMPCSVYTRPSSLPLNVWKGDFHRFN